MLLQQQDICNIEIPATAETIVHTARTPITIESLDSRASGIAGNNSRKLEKADSNGGRDDCNHSQRQQNSSEVGNLGKERQQNMEFFRD